jgi:hypothetical protein
VYVLVLAVCNLVWVGVVPLSEGDLVAEEGLSWCDILKEVVIVLVTIVTMRREDERVNTRIVVWRR